MPEGLLWTYTDCLAKKGPTLITEDKALIGCDPVSGRAQEVNLCWEQLCVATGYDIEIGKDADFNIRVIDWVPVGNAGSTWCSAHPGKSAGAVRLHPGWRYVDTFSFRPGYKLVRCPGVRSHLLLARDGTSISHR